MHNQFRTLFLPILLLTIFVTSISFFYLGKPTTGIDDGCIFLTYAKHISNGEGFVFNTGGEKVEGFTSLTWVLICALFFKIFSAPEIPLIIFLILLNAAALTLLFKELKQTIEAENIQFSQRWLFASFVLFILGIGPLWFTWSVLSLMDNGIWNFLFLSGIALMLKFHRTGKLTLLEKVSLITISALLLLTRPEALLWSAVFSAVVAFTEWQKRRKLGFTFLFVAVQLLTAFALTQFRKSYFGYPLPNTYYAKVSQNRLYNLKEGGRYLFSFLTDFNLIISFLFVLVCVALFFVVKNWRRNDSHQHSEQNHIPSFFMAGVFILVGLGIPLLTGGDHFGGYRFYQGILPLFAWSLPAFFWLRNREAAWRGKRLGNAWLLIAIGTTLLVSSKTMHDMTNPKLGTQLGFEFYLARDGKKMGDELNSYFADTLPSVGVIMAGGFSLNYRGETVDLMGLNNTAMGHSKGERIGFKNHAAFNKDVFYQLRPDFVLPRHAGSLDQARILYQSMLGPNDFLGKAMKNIFNDSLFKELYQPISIQTGGEHIFVFCSRAFMKKIQAEKQVAITLLDQ